jgi:CRP/FNR family transcriptional regulator, anaerobic regulatory protein
MSKAILPNHYFNMLIASLLDTAVISEEALDFVKNKLTFKTYKKNDAYIKKDDIADRLGFILKGATRTFFELNGRESTMFFHFEGNLVTAHDSFSLNIPSIYTIEFIEDTDLFEITRDDVNEVLSKHPVFEKVGRLLTEQIMIYLYNLQILQKLNSKEKYIKILESEPHLILRTKNKHLCSYLNITEQSLSRLKSEIQK